MRDTDGEACVHSLRAGQRADSEWYSNFLVRQGEVPGASNMHVIRVDDNIIRRRPEAVGAARSPTLQTSDDEFTTERDGVGRAETTNTCLVRTQIPGISLLQPLEGILCPY